MCKMCLDQIKRIVGETEVYPSLGLVLVQHTDVNTNAIETQSMMYVGRAAFWPSHSQLVKSRRILLFQPLAKST